MPSVIMAARRSSSGSSPTAGRSRESSPNSDKAANRSKAGIRASLACVPCRSRHIKCDATMPTCLRCQLENKPCYYAKSRRGIRDPRKRSIMYEKSTPVSAVENPWPLTQMSTLDLPIRFLNEMPAGWTLAKNVAPGSSPSSATAQLLDQFYATCFGCFPWVLPKPHLMARIASAPSDMQFLISTLTYVASRYEATVSSDELRESVYGQACAPLPMTPYTVQALSILSITALGECKPDLCSGWLDRAIQIALDIGMQHQAYADAESDPVVAECHRRTYWALYIYDCHRSIRDNLQSFSLYRLRVTTELPCEEWEYQSGSIPRPLSLAAYDCRDPVEEPAFSSWTYTIDLFRLIGEVVLPLKLYPDQPWFEPVKRAETRIANWLVRIPKWKEDAVDPNGSPDMILWLGIGTAHGSRIRLRQPFNRLQLDLKEGFPIGPLERPQVPISHKLDASWNVCPPELDAVNSICQALALWASPSFYNPINIVQTSRMCLALLDACVFLGCDSPAVREKLSLAIAIMKRGAEIWPLARKLVSTIRDVAVAYLPPPPPSSGMDDVVSMLAENVWQDAAGRSMPEVDEGMTAGFYPPLHESISNDGFDQWIVSGE